VRKTGDSGRPDVSRLTEEGKDFLDMVRYKDLMDVRVEPRQAQRLLRSCTF
jgi:hypothetical protein